MESLTVPDDAGFDPFRVFHYGYVVSDMERAVRQWKRQGALLLVEPAADPIQNVCCSLLLFAGSVPIELVAPLPTGPNPVSSRLAKGGGLDHVCLFTNNLEKEVEDMRQSGAVVAVQPCFGSVFRRRLAFLVTRAGLIVELMTKRTVDAEGEDPLRAYFALVGR